MCSGIKNGVKKQPDYIVAFMKNGEIANIEKAEDVLPGTIIEASSKEGLLIATGDGILNVLEIQMPNSKKMLAKDYFNGHTINKGIMCNM